MGGWERTELREAFFAETRQDPYAHMIAKMWTDAWAMGYEQALRDVGPKLDPNAREVVDDHYYEKSGSDRREDAYEYLTDQKRKSEVELVMALAAVGPLFPNAFKGDG